MGIEESHILQGGQALGLVKQRVLWKAPWEMFLAVSGGAGFAVGLSVPGQGRAGLQSLDQGSEIQDFSICKRNKY